MSHFSQWPMTIWCASLALEVAHLAQPLDDGGPGLEPVEPGELAAVLVHSRRLIEHTDHRKAMPAAELVVVEVVRRRDLHGTGAELALDRWIREDRQPATAERQDRLAPDEVAVPVVVGMHRDRGVPEDRLGASGRDADPPVRVRRPILAREVVADRPQRPGLLAVDVLEIADRRPAAWAPVDEGLAAIDEPGVPQPLEGDAHGTRAEVVHREAQPRPVEARPEATVLLADDVARLVHELPHPLEVALAAKRGAALALLGDDPVEDELRGDAGVVDAREPQRVVAAHAVVSDEGVLDGRRQGVAEVERAGHVRRRLDDDEPIRARRRLGRRGEGAAVHPALVDGGLDQGGVVARGELASRRRHRSSSFIGTHKTRSSKDERVVVPPSFAAAP